VLIDDAGTPVLQAIVHPHPRGFTAARPGHMVFGGGADVRLPFL
jgi:hypothetical protein